MCHKATTTTKQRHDAKIKEITFSIGDKVLMYDRRLDTQWSRKLRNKWRGPYYIHTVGQKGFYKIHTLVGQVLKAPINGNLLKPYYENTASTSLVSLVQL